MLETNATQLHKDGLSQKYNKSYSNGKISGKQEQGEILPWGLFPS